jgi:hypothetical protein
MSDGIGSSEKVASRHMSSSLAGSICTDSKFTSGCVNPALVSDGFLTKYARTAGEAMRRASFGTNTRAASSLLACSGIRKAGVSSLRADRDQLRRASPSSRLAMSAMTLSTCFRGVRPATKPRGALRTRRELFMVMVVVDM